MRINKIISVIDEFEEIFKKEEFKFIGILAKKLLENKPLAIKV